MSKKNKGFDSSIRVEAQASGQGCAHGFDLKELKKIDILTI
jgi:hypothetical protein